MVELLSLSDNRFVADAKEMFVAVNSSQSGAITFEELTAFINKQSPEQRSEEQVKSLFMKFHNACDGGHEHDSISWSEWLVLIAFNT